MNLLKICSGVVVAVVLGACGGPGDLPCTPIGWTEGYYSPEEQALGEGDLIACADDPATCSASDTRGCSWWKKIDGEWVWVN